LLNLKVNTFLRLYFLTLPLYIIGISVGGYNFTLGTLAALLLVFCAILQGRKFNYYHVVPFLLFLLWALMTSLIRHPIQSYLPSIISLSIMALPFLFEYDKRDFRGIHKSLITGFFLTVPFMFYDIMVTVASFTPIEELDIPLVIHSRSDWFFGVYRAKATFEEPSFFAIYSVAVYYFLNKKGKSNLGLNLLLIVSVISTLSLTGFILFIIAFINLNLFSYKKWAYSLIFVFAVILTFPEYVENTTRRLSQTVMAVGTTDLVGSVGSRANSFDPVFRYYKQTDVPGAFLGLGYGNTSEWLINEYRFFENRRISFVRGQITNAFALFSLSTGLIGGLLYIFIFLMPFLTRSIEFRDLLLIVLIQFAFAIVIGYFFWAIMLLIKLSNE
jgi:hypothetical protein